MIFIDDCSNDNSVSLIPKNDNFSVVSVSKRMYALCNINDILSKTDFNDEDIIAIIDGDDYLFDEFAFDFVNSIYEVSKCLVSYGQYITSNGYFGNCSSYSFQEFKDIRNHVYRASHLKTFKYKVYKEFLRQDQELYAYKDQKGEIFSMTYDMALMLPLMEIAGLSRIYFNKYPLYIYRLHENNDQVINRPLQKDIEQQIRNKPRFIETSFPDSI
ncbi:hypothetical protein [Olivibacter sp. SDN3]|uniref:hypothetical protein n=1 Tax=Olivibacter sp. SDN3 TaxID=2764720 RepID=UPI00210725CB|nr:hypothetical protein [Olivibacter sp. SDN3]